MSGYPGGDGYQQMHNPSEGPTGPTGGDKEQPQWKRYLSICTLALGAVVGLVMLVISVVAYGQMAGFVSDYESTVDSWETLPVTAIAFVNGQNSCPAGSEYVGSNWPGLYPACNCDVPGHTGNSTSSPTTVCDNQQLADHCVTLPSAHTLPVALNIFPATLMCVTRGGVDSLSRQPDPTNCGAGQFVCGAGSSAFCWPSGSACPITDFVLDSVQYTQAQAGASDAPTEVFIEQPSGTKWYLYVKRGGVLNNLWPNRMGGAFNFTGLPVVDVTFQPSDPCTLSGCGYSGRAAEYAAMSRAYHANAATAGFGYTQKPLPCDGGCMAPDVSGSVSPSGRDVRYSRTNFGLTETALYTAASGVPQQFITANANYQWFLQYRTEIEWSLRCPESRADVVHRQSDVEKVRTAQVVLLVFGVLSFIFLSLYFPCIEVFGKAETKERLSKCNLGCKIVIKSTTLICTIVTVVVAYGTLAFWNAVNRDSICSDPLTDETFQTLGHKFNDLSYKNAITTASAGATSVGDIIVACVNRLL